MSRRKDRGDAKSAGLGLLLVVGVIVAILVGVGVFIGTAIGETAKESTHATPPQANESTTPVTALEATPPTETPKPEEGKNGDAWPNDPPDGAPSNPLFLAARDLEGGVLAKDAEAIVQKYGAYTYLRDPFVSHGEWGDTYIWTWESQEKDWRMRLQYSDDEAHHPGMGIIGIFYTQEHITYRKTLSK